MKKIFLILFFSIFLIANTQDTIKSLIGEKKFNTYKELLTPILNKNASIKDILEYLQDNGLLDIFLSKPTFIHPKFIFLDNNPVFDTKTLYNTLNSIGYFSYYPINITKKENFKITLELNSKTYINPLLFIKTIEKKGCKVIDIKKEASYIYKIDCSNQYLDTDKITKKYSHLINAKGIYWLNTNNFKKVVIYTSKFDKWYPYIVLYDKNLKIIDIKISQNHKRKVYLDIPFNCKYIKIADYYSQENFKRGITFKGIK